MAGEKKLVLVEKLKKLTELAGKLGATLPQLSLAWAIKYAHVSTCILGATSIK